ncbi:MAG: TatD family hydrolase [Patescibacteria group bacterium]
MQIIDTHCHLNLEPLFSGLPGDFGENKTRHLSGKGWRDHWHAAKNNHVTKTIVIGVDPESSEKAILIAREENQIFASVGIHPENLDKNLDSSRLTDLIQKNRQNVVAIGEVGLDYYFLDKTQPSFSQISLKQIELFTKQISLAKELSLPLIIHSRDKDLPETPEPNNAYWQVFSILDQAKLTQPFVLHCCSGPLSFIKAALKLGAYIGIAGNVSYRNADHIRQIVGLTPAERLLLETDAPYLPPNQDRGKICEPWMIKNTADYLQKEFGLDLDQIIVNAKRCFGI